MSIINISKFITRLIWLFSVVCILGLPTQVQAVNSGSTNLSYISGGSHASTDDSGGASYPFIDAYPPSDAPSIGDNHLDPNPTDNQDANANNNANSNKHPDSNSNDDLKDDLNGIAQEKTTTGLNNYVVKTGDVTQYGAYILMLLGAIMILLVIMIIKKNENQKFKIADLNH